MSNKPKSFQRGIILRKSTNTPSLRGELSFSKDDNRLRTVLGNYGDYFENDSTSYVVNDKVRYNGKNYICIQAVTDVVTQDPSNKDYWDEFEGDIYEITTTTDTQTLFFKNIENSFIQGSVSGTAIDTGNTLSGSTNKIPSSGTAKQVIDDDAETPEEFTLDYLKDVNTAGVQQGNVITYDNGQWIPAEAPDLANPIVTNTDIGNTGAGNSTLTELFPFDTSLYASGIYEYTATRVMTSSSTEQIEVGYIYINHSQVNDSTDVVNEVLYGDAQLVFTYNPTLLSVVCTSQNLIGTGYSSNIKVTQLNRFSREVVPTVPTSIVITQEPTSGSANSALSPAFLVEVRDQDNNLITDYSENMTATKSSGSGSLSGTTTVSVSSGVATFSNLILDTIDTYSLTFETAGIPSVTSSTFPVYSSGPVLTPISTNWIQVDSVTTITNGGLTLDSNLGSAQLENVTTDNGEDFAFEFEYQHDNSDELRIGFTDSTLTSFLGPSFNEGLYLLFGANSSTTLTILNESDTAVEGTAFVTTPLITTNAIRTYRIEKRGTIIRYYQDGTLFAQANIASPISNGWYSYPLKVSAYGDFSNLTLKLAEEE